MLNKLENVEKFQNMQDLRNKKFQEKLDEMCIFLIRFSTIYLIT